MFPYRGKIICDGIWLRLQRHQLPAGPLDAAFEVEFEKQGLDPADGDAGGFDDVVDRDRGQAERFDQAAEFVAGGRRDIEGIGIWQPIGFEQRGAGGVGFAEGLDDVVGAGDQLGAL